MKKAIIMGNGPSLSKINFDLVKESKIPTYATNRIAGICRENNWHPSYYCVFFSGPHQGQVLKLPSGEIKDYSSGDKLEARMAQKDIEYLCEKEETTCYVHEWYRYFLKKEYKNVNFSHPHLWNRFKEFPMGIMDNHSAPDNFIWWIATTSLFQLCIYHEVDTIGIVGIDGYDLTLKNNHYEGYKGSDPGNMERSNKMIKRQHDVISDYLGRKKVSVYNLSEKSIIQNYPFLSFEKFLKL